MGYAQTVYVRENSSAAGTGMYNVTFLVNETKTKLTRNFDSPVFAKEFVRKLKHSKRCTLISSPLFE